MNAIPKLREYVNSLPDQAAKEEFASRCGTTLGMLRQIAGGFRPASEAVAINIDRESDGQVPCEEIRPDVDFAYLRGRPRLDSESHP